MITITHPQLQLGSQTKVSCNLYFDWSEPLKSIAKVLNPSHQTAKMFFSASLQDHSC